MKSLGRILTTLAVTTAVVSTVGLSGAAAATPSSSAASAGQHRAIGTPLAEQPRIACNRSVPRYVAGDYCYMYRQTIPSYQNCIAALTAIRGYPKVRVYQACLYAEYTNYIVLEYVIQPG